MSTHLTPNQQRYQSTRSTALVFAGIAIVALGFALFSGKWLVTPGEVAGVGLRKASFCTPITTDNCELSTSELVAMVADSVKHMPGAKQPSSLFAPLGWINTVLIAIGVLLLGAAAFWTYQKPGAEMPFPAISLGLLTMLIVLITGCAFVVTKPGGVGSLGVGPGFFAFGGGVVCGIIASQMMSKVLRGPEPEPDLELH